MYTILEAFGNGATSMNTNASRFSQIVSLDFDQAGQVASASIQVCDVHVFVKFVFLKLWCYNSIKAYNYAGVPLNIYNTH